MTPVALILMVGAAVTQQPADSAPVVRPFHVGERFQYAAKLGFLKLGTAWMSVNSIDTMRGTESFVFEFGLEASAPFYKSTSVMLSWTGTADMISRRFTQDIVENGRPTKRRFDIYPDSLFYTQEERPGTKPSVTEPLDDAAFFYFLRTIPLEIGRKYQYTRYFKQINSRDQEISVKWSCRMAEVNCLILNPVVGSDGIFGPRAEAMLWLTDDERRVPVQIRSKLPFGTVTLSLEKLTPEPPRP
jgi:hypothetical protein